MRILYVAAGTPIPGTHGGSVHALQLCRGLAAAGNEVHLVAQAPDRAARPTAVLDDVILHALPRRPLLAQLEWTLWRQVRRIARQVRPDVVIERFYTFGGTGLLAARAIGVPAVLEVNSPARPYPGSLRDRLDALTLVRPIHRWRHWQLGTACRYYSTAAVLLPEGLRQRTTVVVNGVDCQRIRPGAALPDSGPLRCVFVSSFRPWHGAADLVDATIEAMATGADLHLTCIGEGPTWEEARRRASRSAAAERIAFIGQVPHDEIPRHLASSHLGIAPFSPRHFRALELGWFWSPIKIFEYLAAGLPVLTADIPELRDLLPETVARFYPADDARALAVQLTSLAGQRAELRRASIAARQLAEERYAWERQAAMVDGVLTEALAELR